VKFPFAVLIQMTVQMDTLEPHLVDATVCSGFLHTGKNFPSVSQLSPIVLELYPTVCLICLLLTTISFIPHLQHRIALVLHLSAVTPTDMTTVLLLVS